MPTIVLGTHVPDQLQQPNQENCHHFVYRWLIARGLITGTYPNPNETLGNGILRPILWPTPGGSARHNGNIQVRRGHLVGFWQRAILVHSMIAIGPTHWIGANNIQSCGAYRGGRMEFPNINILLFNNHLPAPRHLGWINANDNQWKHMGGIVRVTHRLPIARHF